MENFIAFIQDSIKIIEDIDKDDRQKSLVASRLDSVCALLSMTIYNLKENQNQNNLENENT